MLGLIPFAFQSIEVDTDVELENCQCVLHGISCLIKFLYWLVMKWNWSEHCFMGLPCWKNLVGHAGLCTERWNQPIRHSIWAKQISQWTLMFRHYWQVFVILWGQNNILLILYAEPKNIIPPSITKVGFGEYLFFEHDQQLCVYIENNEVVNDFVTYCFWCTCAMVLR